MDDATKKLIRMLVDVEEKGEASPYFEAVVDFQTRVWGRIEASAELAGKVNEGEASVAELEAQLKEWDERMERAERLEKK